MTDSLALLAERASPRGKPPMTLRAPELPLRVRADAMAVDHDLVLIRAVFGRPPRERHAYVVLDERGSISAFARGDSHEAAYGRVRDELARADRYELGGGKDQPLRPERRGDDRRASVLKDATGAWSVRAKVIDDDKDLYLHARVAHRSGHFHIVLNEDGSIVAFTTGGNDSDTWDRMRGELKRRGIDVN